MISELWRAQVEQQQRKVIAFDHGMSQVIQIGIFSAQSMVIVVAIAEQNNFDFFNWIFGN